PSPRWAAPTLDPGLESLIMRALAKRPEDRQQSMVELRAALEALMPSRHIPDPLAPPAPGMAPTLVNERAREPTTLGNAVGQPLVLAPARHAPHRFRWALAALVVIALLAIA